METFFASKNYYNKEQAALIRKMEYVHSQCSELNLFCSEDDGKWGVWLMVGEEKVLVDTLSLVNSLFTNADFYMFLSYKEKEYSNCWVDVRRGAFCIDWTIDHPDFPLKGRTMFRFDEYIGKIKQAMTRLLEVMKNGCEVHYSKLDLSLESVEDCLRQLEIKSCLPSEYRLRACDITEEAFHFTPLDCEKYSIGIGNRTFTSFLTHWCNNLELIRHQLESVTYMEDAVIKLSFDDSDTVLTIKHCSILDNINANESGYGFTYKDHAKVIIEPNGFVFALSLRDIATIKKQYASCMKAY